MIIIVMAGLVLIGILIALRMALKHKGDIDMDINILKGKLTIKKKK